MGKLKKLKTGPKNRKMESNFYEEKDMRDGLLDFHQKMSEGMGIPDWALVKCPTCRKRIKENGVRQISVCLNARNFGDIAVEYYCKKCGIMNTVYFQKAIEKSLDELTDYISDGKIPTKDPVVEEEMYKLGYNNIVEKFLKENSL